MDEAIKPDIAALLAAVPFCTWLGLRARVIDERVLLELPFQPRLIGNSMLPALHGGVSGSLLETAAIVQIIFETKAIPKPVDITIDYLRTGKAETSYARAFLVRHGRRIITAHAEMWQENEAKPVASFRGNFLLTESKA